MESQQSRASIPMKIASAAVLLSTLLGAADGVGRGFLSRREGSLAPGEAEGMQHLDPGLLSWACQAPISFKKVSICNGFP